MAEMKIKAGKHRPSYANDNAAGLDIRYAGTEDITIHPGEAKDIETSLAVEIPSRCFGMVVPRSGLGFKHGLSLINTVGIIDSDYRGNIGIKLKNDGKAPYTITEGERVVQMVIIPYIQPDLSFVDTLSDTNRGANGFGSTGKL